MAKFDYSEHDFIYSAPRWNSSEQQCSKFDETLRSSWDKAMDEGHFWFTLADLKKRMVPGNNKYMIMLNVKRGTEKRKGTYMDCLDMPFRHEAFNFTKVKKDEILFDIVPKHWSEQQEDRHLMVINVCPMEYGHVLIVPSVDRCLPQRLTFSAVKLLLEVMLLSTHPGFHIGYNSLCALASVNHLHAHGWYVDAQLLIQYARVKQICGVLHESEGLAYNGFVLQLHGSTVEKLASDFVKIVNHLHDKNIAHNVFWTRGPAFCEDVDGSKRTIRVYIWPRIKVIGSKNEEGLPSFNVAVAELAGNLLLFAPDLFPTLTEAEIDKGIQEFALPKETFLELGQELSSILTVTKCSSS